MTDNTVLMYGCPTTDFIPPEDRIWPITTIINRNTTVEDYKNKFVELFKQMEIVLGPCKHVSIESDSQTNEPKINIVF